MNSCVSPVSKTSDSGSALILALVIVTVIGLVLGAILSLASTGTSTGSVLAAQRDRSADAEGAVHGVINTLRSNALLGVAGGTACGPKTYPAGTDGVVVTVDCSAQPGSGGTFNEQPPFAILTTGSASTDGLNQSGNAELTVDGGVYSRKKIDLTRGGSRARLTVYGNVTALGSCTPAASVSAPTGTVACDAPDDGRWNVAYPPAVSAAPTAVDPSPDCSNPAYVTFSPGTYSEVPSAPGCTQTNWWFKPGTFYFDFPPGSDEWNLDTDKKTIVAGTLTGTWSLPGACRKGAGVSGTQFIFGGTSRIVTASHGNLEICAPSPAGAQHIALYGLATGSRASRTTSLNDPHPTTSGPTKYVLADPKASTINNESVPMVYADDGSASVDFDFPAVPDGARITSVIARVAHAESVGTPAMKVSLSAIHPGGRADLPLPSCVRSVPTDLCVNILDLTAELTGRYAYREVQNLQLRFQSEFRASRRDPGGTSWLDGVQLDVIYEPPGFEAVCAGCELLKSTVDQNLFFHGTLYAPTAQLTLRVHNQDFTIFDRGVVAKRLDVDVSASSKQSNSPFQLPSASGGLRRVLLTAKVDGVPVLRAVVAVADNDGARAFPGKRVIIERWDLLRDGS